jgi:sec-independent protein translocase protein TatA
LASGACVAYHEWGAAAVTAACPRTCREIFVENMVNAMNILALFGNVGWMEILIILVVVLILFGGKRLPELARGLAKGIKSFKKEMKSVGDEMKDAMSSDDDTLDSEDNSNEDKSPKS